MSQPANAGAVLYALKLERVSAFYEHCCGLRVAHVEADHVVLESSAFQLVIVAIPARIASTISLSAPPARREDTPIKLWFPVSSIDAIRARAAQFGGSLDSPEREWLFQGRRVCDGVDPEGNVVQFRECGKAQ